MGNLPKDMHGSGILGTTAGEEVGLSGLPDRSSVVQLMEFGQSSSSVILACSISCMLQYMVCSGIDTFILCGYEYAHECTAVYADHP